MTTKHSQLSLLNLMLITMLAGGFVGLNCRCELTYEVRLIAASGSMSRRYGFEVYGWPLPVVWREVHFEPAITYGPIGERSVQKSGRFQIYFVGIIANAIAFCLFIYLIQWGKNRFFKPH